MNIYNSINGIFIDKPLFIETTRKINDLQWKHGKSKQERNNLYKRSLFIKYSNLKEHKSTLIGTPYINHVYSVAKLVRRNLKCISLRIPHSIQTLKKTLHLSHGNLHDFPKYKNSKKCIIVQVTMQSFRIILGWTSCYTRGQSMMFFLCRGVCFSSDARWCLSFHLDICCYLWTSNRVKLYKRYTSWQ